MAVEPLLEPQRCHARSAAAAGAMLRRLAELFHASSYAFTWNFSMLYRTTHWKMGIRVSNDCWASFHAAYGRCFAVSATISASILTISMIRSIVSSVRLIDGSEERDDEAEDGREGIVGRSDGERLRVASGGRRRWRYD